MKNYSRILLCGLMFITGVAVNQAVAEENDLPVAQTEYQGIPYLSGGASLDEREKLDAESRNYSLKLVFAGKNGEYLSDIKVGILGRTGKRVLDAVSNGPWFFCKLPPGQYTVSATMMGKEKRSRVNIGKGQSTLRFYWTERDYL